MKFQIDIARAVVVSGSGPDIVMLETSLPEGYYPFKPGGGTLRIETGAGLAEDYLAKHFPGLPVFQAREGLKRAIRIDWAADGVVNGVFRDGRRVFSPDGVVVDAEAFRDAFGQDPSEHSLEDTKGK